MRITYQGFTLIEVLVFIIVSSILMATLLLGSNTALLSAPNTHQQWVSLQVARQCMEWFINQRRINGYSALTCPSAVTPSACVAPSGYSIATNIACTTWNSDSNYKTITVTVNGMSNAALMLQVGE